MYALTKQADPVTAITTSDPDGIEQAISQSPAQSVDQAKVTKSSKITTFFSGFWSHTEDMSKTNTKSFEGWM